VRHHQRANLLIMDDNSAELAALITDWPAGQGLLVGEDRAGVRFVQDVRGPAPLAWRS
jgi:hypothetical protein